MILILTITCYAWIEFFTIKMRSDQCHWIVWKNVSELKVYKKYLLVKSLIFIFQEMDKVIQTMESQFIKKCYHLDSKSVVHDNLRVKRSNYWTSFPRGLFCWSLPEWSSKVQNVLRYVSVHSIWFRQIQGNHPVSCFLLYVSNISHRKW